MKRRANTGLNIGSSSILVIFVLLCLTTFATLSMVSANADYKLTQRTALAIRQYYEADAHAEKLFAEVDSALKHLFAAAGADAYRSRTIRELPVAVEGVSAYADGENAIYLAYSVPINDMQELKVTLSVLPVPADGMYCKPTEWRVVNLSEYEEAPESDMEGLWGGDTLPFLG